MKKYSPEWKEREKKWIEKHKRSDGSQYWAIHYMANELEYTNGEFQTEDDAQVALNFYNI
jgi:hypothetical protein